MERDVNISVIVPVYNAELYLHRCIDSILKQTYQEFEVILIDDGSKDDSGAICDEYANKDARVHVIHKENGGVSAARNTGIQEARGSYISFVDSDDYLLEDMFEKLIFCAEQCRSDIVLCEYNILRGNGVVESVKLDFHNSYENEQEIREEFLFSYYKEYRAGIYCLWNKLFKKSIIINYEIGFDTCLRRGEDAWFVFQYLRYCKRVDFIAKPYYCYYQNEESIMHKTYDDQYEKWVDMRKRLLKENESLNFDIDYKLFYKDFLYKVSVYCRELAKTKRYDMIIKIVNDQFYLQAINYSDGFPVYIQIIHCIARKRWGKLTCLLYWVWGLKK